MFKSIFSRLVFIFISILIISFSVAGGILYYFIDNFLMEEKETTLVQAGEDIRGMLKTVLDNRNTINAPYYWETFNNALETLSRNIGAIWVVNSSGYIEADVAFRDDVERYIKGKFIYEGGKYRLPEEQQYAKVMSSGDIVKEKGDFYNLFNGTGVSWLTVEIPFTYGGEVVGAVYLHTPAPEIYRMRTAVLRFFVISVAVSAVISVILVYIASLRISKPLKEIKNAARIIAGGEFQKRLHIDSRDEIGELAASFNNMAVALQNLEEMRRGFIANVSHELRTPMTSIRGFIEGILDGTVPQDRQNEYLTIVKDETNRLNRLVNDLLDLARMESGEMKLQLKGININELVRRCVIKLESIIVRKDIHVEASFHDEEIYAIADRDAIERVLINLIHNAVKFTPDGGTITIGTAVKRDKIEISIADTGIGIEKEEINLIWDRFYKSDKSRSKDKIGTGLGLAIVKNIINEHGQNIWVESGPGKGSVFTFTLDRTSAAEKG